MEESTAQCVKCTTSIPTDAVKCPQCGYEPSREGRISGGILLLICLPVCLFSGLVAVISLLLLFSGTPPSTALFGFAFFGVFAAASGSALYMLYKKKNQTPTDPSLND